MSKGKKNLLSKTKFLIIPVLLISVLFVIGAKSCKPVPVERITQEEFDEVKELIDKAINVALAREYAQQTIQDSEDNFNTAVEKNKAEEKIAEESVAQAREHLLKAKELAVEAYNKSFQKRAIESKAIADEQFSKTNADNLPEDLVKKYKDAKQTYEEANTAFSAENFETAYYKYEECISKFDEFISARDYHFENNQKNKITDEEFKKVNEYIEKAKWAKAEYYAPDLYKEAVNNLNEARNLNSSDPVSARDYLDKAKQAAIKAYEEAFRRRALEQKAKVDALIEEADSIKAESISKDEYDSGKKHYSEGDRLLDSNDYESSLKEFRNAEDEIKKAIRNTNNYREDFEYKIEYVRTLIKKAEKLGAPQYSNEEYLKAKDNLSKSILEYSDLKYEDSKISLDLAEEMALLAIKNTEFALEEIKRLEALRMIKEAGKAIEDASKTDVGEEKLDPYNFQFNEDDKDDDNLSNSTDDFDPSKMTYKEALAKAIEYIDKAKQAYKHKEWDQAIRYAKIAKRIADNFQPQGYKTKYTVRLIPERRDCLWRIAEYDFIYADPYLWPRIWKANKKDIFNPDLIYPGQVFKIPEMD